MAEGIDPGLTLEGSIAEFTRHHEVCKKLMDRVNAAKKPTKKLLLDLQHAQNQRTEWVQWLERRWKWNAYANSPIEE